MFVWVRFHPMILITVQYSTRYHTVYVLDDGVVDDGRKGVWKIKLETVYSTVVFYHHNRVSSGFHHHHLLV